MPFMKDQATPHLAFPFVRGFAVFLFSVDWAWRKKASAKSRSYYRRVLIGGIAPNRKPTDRNRGILDEMNNKFEMFLLLFLLTFSEICLSLCLPDCSGLCKMMGPVLKFDAKYYCMGFGRVPDQ
jgi:hypothetical protein